MKKKDPFLIFALLSLPSTLLMLRNWLWLMGIVDKLDMERASWGVGFVLVNYIAAGVFAGAIADAQI